MRANVLAGTSLFLLLALAGCQVRHINTARPAAPPLRPLPEVLDCLREGRLALVVAQRGRMHAQAPENSIESYRNTTERGPMVIQVNVARSSDGVLMLLHDPNLDRTTTGQGPLSARTYRQLREFQLKGPEGKILDERIPTLEEALVLARRRGALLQLNPAPVILLAELLELLRGLRMERQVILQTGSLAQTREALKAAPEIMLSAASRSPAELAALGKLANPQLIAFIGQREPDPALVARLDQVGIELAVATSAEPGGNVSGKPGERQDDSPKADGKASRYADLASRGAALIATDEPLVAWRALKAADRDGTVCLGGQAR